MQIRLVGLLVYAVLAILLENIGVGMGIYVYPEGFLLRIGYVPISIIIGWVLMGYFSFRAYGKQGKIALLIPIITVLIFEPTAYFTHLWVWTNTYTPQIYFNSTVPNLTTYIVMSILAIKLFKR